MDEKSRLFPHLRPHLNAPPGKNPATHYVAPPTLAPCVTPSRCRGRSRTLVLPGSLLVRPLSGTGTPETTRTMENGFVRSGDAELDRAVELWLRRDKVSSAAPAAPGAGGPEVSVGRSGAPEAVSLVNKSGLAAEVN